MQFSQSSNSPSKIKWLVILCRVAVGVTFIVSGLAKSVDPWGFLYKTLEYLEVWGLDVPRSLVLVGSIFLSAGEFIAGFMTLLGCYRRAVAWLLLATMAVMLPLTLYIMIADPVSDCGCFGDLFVISNTATFLKNVALTAAIAILVIYNKRVKCIVSPYIQWLPALICAVYALTLCIIGYNEQPLLDFRGFPAGSTLTGKEDADDKPEFSFVYEKNGQKQEFGINELPDSTWTFVERRLVSGTDSASKDPFSIYESGEDVTYDVIDTEHEQLIILIPDMRYADISSTYTINELNRYIEARGGSMIGVIGSDEAGLELWREISMPEYALFTAEPTQIKELARGNVAIVYLDRGVIKWKQTMSTLSNLTVPAPGEKGNILPALDPEPLSKFKGLTILFVIAMVLIVGINNGVLAVWEKITKFAHCKKMTNIQQQDNNQTTK